MRSQASRSRKCSINDAKGKGRIHVIYMLKLRKENAGDGWMTEGLAWHRRRALSKAQADGRSTDKPDARLELGAYRACAARKGRKGNGRNILVPVNFLGIRASAVFDTGS